RLHRSEGIPIKEIARLLGVARNTVRAALASERAPRYERARAGSLVDGVEVEVRKLLKDFPRMPATVIAERIGWQYSITTLKDRIRQIRPEYAGVDPADRTVYKPGDIAQCDLWFPEPRIPVGHGQLMMLPVLVMTLGFSRFSAATMLPSRQAGDLIAGMWQLISGLGMVPKTLVWDRESAIGGKGVVTVPAASFAG
ncbi:IS21 family transposase, partial [Subtercola boreus]